MKKKKLTVIIAITVALAILLIPIRFKLKDGGSVVYKSLLYEVTKIHRMTSDGDGVRTYIDGLEVEIFGMTIYCETSE